MRSTIVGLAILLFIGCLVGLGRCSRDPEVDSLKEELQKVKQANEFKRELIHAYEDYYDADGDSTSYDKWHRIDSLYRSQL